MGTPADFALPIICMNLFIGVTSRDIQVFVGDSLSIRCSPNESTDIQWFHNSYSNYVYAGRILRPPYDRNFLLKKDETTGYYELIIPKATLKDAGIYHCSREKDGRQINSTQLTVLNMKPVCTSNMPSGGFVGPNTCSIQEENMTFSCDVTFNGTTPHLRWRSANGSQAFNRSSSEVKSNRISCSLTLRADPSYDRSVFICDVGQINMDDQRYSCNTKRIKVHYFDGEYGYEEKYVHKNASCMVRTNVNVRYNWTLQRDDEEIFLTSSRTVSIEKSGLHLCKVEYTIRNVTCTLLVSAVNATAMLRIETQKEQSTTTLLALATTFWISIVLIVALIIIGLFIHNLRRRKKKYSQYSPVSDVESPTVFGSNCETRPKPFDKSELINHLEKNRVFDEVQLNEALLEILRNNKLLSYWMTIRAMLHHSNQSHAAETLETGGYTTSSLIFPGSANLLSIVVNIPLELIDIILQKSYLISIQRQQELLQNQIDEVVIKLLASVDFCWFQIITRRRFKKVVWSKLKKHNEDKCKLYLMYKNNQQFFEEALHINGKTRVALSTYHLSNSESANEKIKRRLKKRQTENEMLRKAFLGKENEDSVIEDFLSSYCPKDQKPIREILKTGGGAARVEMKSSRPFTKLEMIPQQFENKDMKILRPLADRDAVVWIWCHSNNALQKLNNGDGLKKLIEIVQQSAEAPSDVLEHKTNIDCDHLKKKIVSIPLVFADFRTTLDFYRENLSENRYSDEYRVIDVTKLKMKIYVLCMINSGIHEDKFSFSTMICVFEDASPYQIVGEILLRRFVSYSRATIQKEFKSIVSSVKENCLYLLTSSKKENQHMDEVFRVRESVENSLQDPSKWLELENGYRPYALSISRNEDDLIMVSRPSPTILRIYDSDARLRLSAEMHKDILEARKAVETSNGNFIILHKMRRQTEYENNSDRGKDTTENDRDFVFTVSEVSRDGKTIIRRFIPKNQQQELFFVYGGDLCIGTRDRVFVADTGKDRIIVLDSYLRWIGNLIPQSKNGDQNEKIRCPLKLFYDENSREMITTEEEQVSIYDVIFK